MDEVEKPISRTSSLLFASDLRRDKSYELQN